MSPTAENQAIERFMDQALLLGRNGGPALLLEWWECGLLSIDDLRHVLPGVWVSAEFPVRAIGERAWLRMFKTAGYVYCLSSDAGVFISGHDPSKPPTCDLEVYRGARLQTRGRGMSWSLDREKAQWFAERWAIWRVPAGVFAFTAPPRAVLAMFNDRAEQEVVVNPHMLRNRLRLVNQLPFPLDSMEALQLSHATPPPGRRDAG